MNEVMKLRYLMEREVCSTQSLLDDFKNPLVAFQNNFIDGPIIDIGCGGQSGFVLDFYRQGKQLYALDDEEFQLDLLKDRISEVNTSNKGNIVYLHQKFPEQDLPLEKFSIMILSNILHFFTFEECKKLIDKLLSYLKKGSILLVKVHSTFHTLNTPEFANIETFPHIKHFFHKDDLSQLFSPNVFDQVHCIQVAQLISEREKEFTKQWIRRACIELERIVDEDAIKKNQDTILEINQHECYIQCIYRKK